VLASQGYVVLRLLDLVRLLTLKRAAGLARECMSIRSDSDFRDGLDYAFNLENPVLPAAKRC